MKKGMFFSRAAVKPSRASLAILLAWLCCASGPAAARQQPRPNIADEVEGEKKTQPRDVDSKPAKESRPARRTASPPRRDATTLLPVTLLVGAAGVDIYLEHADGSAYKLGTTHQDGALAFKLPRGTHNLIAARPGSGAVRQQIEVRPGRTTFNLELARAATAEVAAAPAQPVVTAEDVFRRFLDPRQTEGVTLADWQAAQAETAAAYSHNSEDPQTAAQAHFAFGQVAYLGGDYQTAVNSFNNAALVLPNSALAFYGLGNAYLAARRPAEAARAYQQALKIKPNMALATKGMGDALYSQGKSKESLDYYARARALGYDSPALELGLARGLLKERRWQQALDVLLALSKSQPSSEVFVRLGDSYAGLGRTADAAEAYRQAVKLDPRSALAQYRLGEVSYQLRDYAAARDALERALALDADGASFDRGRARELAGKSAAQLEQKR